MKLLCSHVLVSSHLSSAFALAPLLEQHRVEVGRHLRGASEYRQMGFGEKLWCPQAHAALLRLLDSELHLMEVMKKWMGQRAKSEREFSVQLHGMATMVEKLDRSQHAAGVDYISQLNQVRAAPAGSASL